MAILSLFPKNVLPHNRLAEILYGYVTDEKFLLDQRLNAVEFLLSDVFDGDMAESFWSDVVSVLSQLLASRSVDARMRALTIAMEIKKKKGGSSLEPLADSIQECARNDWPVVMRLACGVRA